MAITEGMVRIAIEVLREYAAETLQIDDDTLAAELEQAIEDAGNRQIEQVLVEVEPEPPEPPLVRSA